MMSIPVVTVKEGKLQGKICKTIRDNIDFYVFKGIPYAKPPVGDLRFSMPAAPEPWDGIRDATKNCNICPQFDKETKSVLGNEDCLYLNVYTPKLPSDKPLLPVMVFMHGGGFVYGHGTDDSAHGPDYFIEKNVVIVSLNYRLGILGFLSLDRKDAPGNMGLRDQVQALKWVQENINQFGGDPKNVTIFGVSAGGASVEYLLLSPLAKGLFHKAIAQSGSSLLPWAFNTKIKDLAYEIPLIKEQTITDDEQLLQYLKDLPIEELISLSIAALATDTWRGGIHFGFVPTVENPGDWVPFLDKKPYDLLSEGKFTKVPFIAGICSREGLIMVSHGAARLEHLKSNKNFIAFLPFEIEEKEKYILNKLVKTIYSEGDQKFDEEDAYAIDFFSDVDFIGGGYISASLIAQHNSPVFFYEFAYDGNLNYLKKKYNINRKGACHGDEGGYLIKSDLLLGEKLTFSDKLVQNRLVDMWTNFAKYSDPTPQINETLDTKWEPIKPTGLTYLHIDEHLEMKEEFYPERVKLYEQLFSKYEFRP